MHAKWPKCNIFNFKMVKFIISEILQYKRENRFNVIDLFEFSLEDPFGIIKFLAPMLCKAILTHSTYSANVFIFMLAVRLNLNSVSPI